MEDGTGTRPGANAPTYHHVLGGTIADLLRRRQGLRGVGSYPTRPNDVFCLSCHVDHDKFNAEQGGQPALDDITDRRPRRRTDYSTRIEHRRVHELPRRRASPSRGWAPTRRTTARPPRQDHRRIAARTSSAPRRTTTTATSTYRRRDRRSTRNCVEVPQRREQPDYKVFQTSIEPVRHALVGRAAHPVGAGRRVTDPLGETHCYGCHTGGTAGNDFYGVRADDAGGRRDAARSSSSTSRHPVVGGERQLRRVRELPQPARGHRATSKVTDPATPTTPQRTTTESQTGRLLPEVPLAAARFPTTTVERRDLRAVDGHHRRRRPGAMNKSTYGDTRPLERERLAHRLGEVKSLRGLPRQPRLEATVKLLGVYDASATARTRSTARRITGNDNTSARVPRAHAEHAATRTRRVMLPRSTRRTGPIRASDGTSAAPNGIHKAGGDSRAASTGRVRRYIDGDCNELPRRPRHRATPTTSCAARTRTRPMTRTPSRSASTATTAAVRRRRRHRSSYFPTTVGGSATQTPSTRFGHKTESAGTLPAGVGAAVLRLPQPARLGDATHGLLVVTMTDSTTKRPGRRCGRTERGTTRTRQRRVLPQLSHDRGSASPNTDAYGWNGLRTATRSSVLARLSRASTEPSTTRRTSAASSSRRSPATTATTRAAATTATATTTARAARTTCTTRARVAATAASTA